MESNNVIKISDLYRLAVLDCLHIPQISCERDRRYYGIFDAEKSGPILVDYDSGTLQVSARELVASIQRVKDRIFEGRSKSKQLDVQDQGVVSSPA